MEWAFGSGIAAAAARSRGSTGLNTILVACMFSLSLPFDLAVADRRAGIWRGGEGCEADEMR